MDEKKRKKMLIVMAVCLVCLIVGGVLLIDKLTKKKNFQLEKECHIKCGEEGYKVFLFTPYKFGQQAKCYCDLIELCRQRCKTEGDFVRSYNGVTGKCVCEKRYEYSSSMPNITKLLNP